MFERFGAYAQVGREGSTKGGYTSFTGCDIIPICIGRDSSGKDKIFVIGDISTLSYSIHQDKGAVRTLGRYLPKSIVRGGITIAGTMVFSVLNYHALWKISEDKHGSYKRFAKSVMLPPFDIVLMFANEYGQQAIMSIFGVQIADEGQTHSVQDMYIENTMNYVALDIDMLSPIGEKVPSKSLFIASQKERIRGEIFRGISDLPFDYSFLH